MEGKLGRSEEAALAHTLEATADDENEWVFERPLTVDRGPNPCAVLSVRLPLDRFRVLGERAAARGVSITQALDDAVQAYIDTVPGKELAR